jgi:type II secretory pathway pseudopilin PulG
MSTHNKILTAVKQRSMHSGAGFTLVELVITVVIMITLTTIVVANYGSASKQLALTLETRKVLGDLRRVQNLALGAVEFNGAIFADAIANEAYDSPSELFQTVVLEQGVHFGNTGGVITFEPPNPNTHLNGSESGSITMTLMRDTAAKTITVNAAGLIDPN